eukprot:7600533-Pyramimonas_sp.AAC.1
MLLHAQGRHATSWGALRRAPSPESEPTFQECARHMGLLHDDVEATAALEEACRITTSLPKLCELFAQLLVWMEVQDKTAYWAGFKAALLEHHRETHDTI